MINVSAPGKLMLVGEHAVVYGHPCIVTAVDQRMFVKVQKTGDKAATIEAPQTKDTAFVDRVIENFQIKTGISVDGVRIKTLCPFSGTYGFGSSAAVTVAAAKALFEYFRINISLQELFSICFQTVLDVQGVGSGFDVAAAIFGSTIYYQDSGRVINPIKFGLGKDAQIIVGYSGVKSNTVDIVKKVALLKKKNPEKINKIFNQIGKLVKQAKNAIKNSDYQYLGDVFNQSQKLLTDLRVSSEKLDKLIEASLSAGAWGAKLSGAGGGDCMIAITPKNKLLPVKNAIKGAGGEVVDTNINAEGVRLEN